MAAIVKKGQVPVANPQTTSSRDVILDAAKRLIMQYGYDGFSMRQLADECGLAKSTLYHHFRDKEDLYLQVLEREMRCIREALAPVVDEGGAPEVRLRLAIQVYMAQAMERRHSTMLLLQQGQRMKEQVLDLVRRHMFAVLHPYQEILAEGAAAGVFRDVNPGETAAALLGLMNSFVTSQHFLGQDAEDAPVDQARVERLVDLFLYGVVASPGSKRSTNSANPA